VGGFGMLFQDTDNCGSDFFRVVLIVGVIVFVVIVIVVVVASIIDSFDLFIRRINGNGT